MSWIVREETDSEKKHTSIRALNWSEDSFYDKLRDYIEKSVNFK